MTDVGHGHPNPDYEAGFYAGVPTKRLIAWLADSVLIGLLTLLAIPFTAFLGLFFLPRYLKSGITTIPQFLEERFGSGVRSIAAASPMPLIAPRP